MIPVLSNSFFVMLLAKFIEVYYSVRYLIFCYSTYINLANGHTEKRLVLLGIVGAVI